MSVDGRGGGVLLVGDGGQPVDDGVVGVGLVDREVDHQPVGRGAVPVLLVGLEQDAVAGRMTSTGPPRRWHRPTPSVTKTVWLSGWRCQWVRAPGKKCTRLAVTRDGGGAAATASM